MEMKHVLKQIAEMNGKLDSLLEPSTSSAATSLGRAGGINKALLGEWVEAVSVVLMLWMCRCSCSYLVAHRAGEEGHARASASAPPGHQ